MAVAQVALGATTSAGANATAESLSSSDCGSAWRIVPSPNLGSGNNELYGLGVVSANDIWAAGRFSDATGYKTLAMHWDGNVWNIVTTPNVGSSFNQLYSVAAVSSNNVWAVGASSDNNVLFQPLIEHWDGTQWSTIGNPLAPGTSAFIYGIFSVAANDIWAVGYIQIGFSAQQPLAVHWDGNSWSLVQTPSTSPANNDILWSVTALSPGNVWAAGYSVDRVSGNYNTLIEHWDGSAWSIVPSPNPSGSIYNFLWGIEAVSPNDIWVMGRAYTGAIYPGLFEHWNGSAWSIISSGPSEKSYTELYGAVALSSTDVWAVGRDGDGFTTNLTLIEHWDGSAWSPVPHPEPAGSTESYLNSAKAASTNDLWTVGAYLKDDTIYQTLIERYSNVPCITPTSVVSRKTHGSAGDFDVNLPVSGTPGIECRSGSVPGSHQVVITFAVPITVTDGSVTPGPAGTASIVLAPGHQPPNEVVATLSDVSNAQTLTINLLGVSDGISTSDVHVPMSVLLGDVNSTGRTDSGDVTAVRNRTVSIPDQQTFRFDVNTSGRIDSGDVTVTRNASVTVLP